MGISRSLWDDSPLRDDIAFWLRLADTSVIKRIAEALRPFDLRPGLYAAMKIIELQAENVKRLRAVTISPEGHIVEISGRNGQGKSSVPYSR